MRSSNAAGVEALVAQHEWPNGDIIVASALSNGPTFLLAEWVPDLRLNPKKFQTMTQLWAALVQNVLQTEVALVCIDEALPAAHLPFTPPT